VLIGYVSDERYVAVADVMFEFENDDGTIVEIRSSITGAVRAELKPGRWTVAFGKEGYGAKRVTLDLPLDEPNSFRLLRDQLLGYMWPKWVRGGEQAEFRVHSDEAFGLELWRYGWEKERVGPIGWYDEHGPRATVQITPDGDYTQTGVRFNSQGYARKAHKQFVTAPERSGLYYLHAKGESGAFFSFPWIVAPAKPQAKLAVLAANINWNCYNNFGGRSNYIHADQFAPTPTMNARLELSRYTDPDHASFAADAYAPLSFDRPEPLNHIDEHERITDPIEGRSNCHVAPAEWRFFGWLEREGFEYDLYAETQLHDGTLDLDAYDALAVSAHPEYWSAKMYFALKEWVFERGGKLAYLGGNGLNCEVEFTDDSTIVVHNGPYGGGFFHLQKLGYESRLDLRHESEANLLGVVCSETGLMTGAPYRTVEPDHWIFDGTGLQKGDLFGENCLHMRCPGGASGHETDKISASSPANAKLLAKGLNPDDGGAEIVCFGVPGGGHVFSVGSISWPAALPVDAHVSQITRNVLQRFLD
jgi:hypothetical protein